MKAADIIGKFGGTSSLARLMNLNASTVDSWRYHNAIPEWRQARLLELAVERNLELSTSDFPTPAERVNPRKAAA
jgi:hypothetical protein